MESIVHCTGRISKETADQLRQTAKGLISESKPVVLDFAGVNYLDSSGLGALVGLKISAVNQGLCILHFENMTPRVLELMRLTGLAQLMSS